MSNAIAGFIIWEEGEMYVLGTPEQIQRVVQDLDELSDRRPVSFKLIPSYGAETYYFSTELGRWTWKEIA